MVGVKFEIREDVVKTSAIEHPVVQTVHHRPFRCNILAGALIGGNPDYITGAMTVGGDRVHKIGCSVASVE